MDSNIPFVNSPPNPAGPFAPSALAQRALRELRDQADSLTARGYSPDEITVALTKTAQLWRARGADLPEDIIRTIIPRISPDAALIVEQVQHVYFLAAWLYGHAETEIAGLIVDAAQVLLLAIEEEELLC
jgi:hypothetical protein